MVFKSRFRYPKHDGDKGQVLGGECNRTRCKSGDAVIYNMATTGFYCRPCGHGLNWQHIPGFIPKLAVEIDFQPESEDDINKIREKYEFKKLLERT